MTIQEIDFAIDRLGECLVPSPLHFERVVPETARVAYDSDPAVIQGILSAGKPLPSLEMAGPREKIFFDPAKLNCGMVTCGGICPGLNDVIRAVTMSLHHHYGVKAIYGFQYGYEGLVERYGHRPLELTPETTRNIHDFGGTILGSSRGNQDVGEMVDFLVKRQIGILFTIGGDGTMRGARAMAEEIRRRGLKIAVVGIPKTIDNDIAFIQTSFGFDTAVSEAWEVVRGAHNEATSARNGVGLVKLMGRDSGFISAYATLASGDVNFCLVPEASFTLEGLCRALEQRLKSRGHALIVVAQGAGQKLFEHARECDASGNIKYGDIGVFLRDQFRAHFKKLDMEINLKYIDPSYTIRSLPASPTDSAFCILLGQNAVHAAMAGKTNMLAGTWKDEFTHVPIHLAVAQRKRIDPHGHLWTSVLASTGQPAFLD